MAGVFYILIGGLLIAMLCALLEFIVKSIKDAKKFKVGTKSIQLNYKLHKNYYPNITISLISVDQFMSYLGYEKNRNFVVSMTQSFGTDVMSWALVLSGGQLLINSSTLIRNVCYEPLI